MIMRWSWHPWDTAEDFALSSRICTVDYASTPGATRQPDRKVESHNRQVRSRAVRLGCLNILGWSVWFAQR